MSNSDRSNALADLITDMELYGIKIKKSKIIYFLTT